MHTLRFSQCMIIVLSIFLIGGNSFSQKNENTPFAPTFLHAPCDKNPKITCPPNITLCPGSDTDPRGTGYAKGLPGSPSCDPPIVEYNDRITSTGPCDGAKIIQRLWTAVDPTDPLLRSFCIQYITLEDKTPPVFYNCPHDTTLQSNESCFAFVRWTPPLATDECSGFTVKTSHPNGSNFPTGKTTVTYTATDDCGNISTCSFVVTVLENCCNKPPIIQCPNDFKGCMQSASTNITGKGIGTPGGPLCLTPFVSYLDDTLHMTACSLYINRVWTATDPNNKTLHSSCTQHIDLSDHENPKIICPPDITVNSDSTCMAVVTWNDPVVSDNCSTVRLVSSHPSGTSFPVGITTVFYTAYDDCGNNAGCHFTVTVIAQCCNKPPVLICPADFSGCPQGAEPAITGRASALKSSKYCMTPLVSYKDDTLHYAACSLRIQRNWIAADPNSGQKSECQQLIDMKDTQGPAITIHGDIEVPSGPDCSAIVQWPVPGTSDNCSLVTLQATHHPGDKFPLGVTKVTYTATDQCGNISTASFNVTVTDHCCDVVPVIHCPPDFTTGCPKSSIEPQITGLAQVLNRGSVCSGAIIGYADTILHQSSCSLRIVRTWTAVDSFKSSLKSSCEQRIIQKDTIPPVIHCPSDISVPSDEHCVAVVKWQFEARDNCSPVKISSSHESGAEFPVGRRTIYYTVFDECSNSSGCQFDVTVLDNCCNEAPEVNCPPDFHGCPLQGLIPSATGMATVHTTSQCGHPILIYRDDTLYAKPCSLFVKRYWIGIDSVHSELRDSCIQLLELKDDVSPTILCPADVTVASSEKCTAIVNWHEPQVSDNCSATTLTSTYRSGDEFGLGTTTVEYTVRDQCNNITHCSFKITVEEHCCIKSPKITCPPDIVECPGSADPGRLGLPGVVKGNPACNAPLVHYRDEILYQSACSTLINRTWIAEDPDHPILRDSCVQKIELSDVSGPVFSGCPADITIDPNYNCEAFPNWTEPVATDQCRLTSVTRTHGPGSRFVTGVTIVSYTAVDACGNSSVCSFNVTVTDKCCDKPPILVCPPEYRSCPSTSLDPSVTGRATVDRGSSNCLNPILTYTDKVTKSGPCPGAATIERTWLAIDPNIPKLAVTCVQKIILSDAEAPVISGMPKDITIDAHGVCETKVQWTAPTASDNCKLVSLNSNVANGSLLKGGVTKVTYTATDACGNFSTASFNITITGTEIQLDCPNDTLVYRTNPAQNGVAVQWPLPKAHYCKDCVDSITGFVYMGEFAGNRYFCSLSPSNWFDAKISCALNGGQLAVIQSKEENAFIASKLMGQIAWIGASDERREGAFDWVDFSPFIYKNWRAGRPSSANPLHDYVELNPDGTWNDQLGSISREYICQISCYKLKQIEGPANGSVIPCGKTRVSYTASKDGVSDTCSFNIEVNCDSISKYCNNRALNTGVMWIDRITVGAIHNTSGDNGGYAYFNQPCGVFENNKVYDLCVEPGFKSNVYVVYWKVWIDFNNDGEFQATELVLLGSGSTGLCGKFSLPQNYMTGKVRMRVIMSYGGYASSACSSVVYGEVEDYCVELTKNGTIILQTSENTYPRSLKCVRNCEEKAQGQFDEGSLISRTTSTLSGFEVVPNPARDEVSLFGNTKEISGLNIYDLNGKLIWRKIAPVQAQEIIDVSHWSEGVYYILVEYYNKPQAVQKLIVQR